MTDDGAVPGDGPAQYSPAEQSVIRMAVLAESAPHCPRCEAHPALIRKGIGGGSFGLGYQRKRDWFVCPHCRRSAIFDLKRGTRN
jgi:transposase-like protein